MLNEGSLLLSVDFGHDCILYSARRAGSTVEYYMTPCGNGVKTEDAQKRIGGHDLADIVIQIVSLDTNGSWLHKIILWYFVRFKAHGGRDCDGR